MYLTFILQVADLYQNRVHRKPLCVLNVEGYYGRLLEWLDHSVSEGFMYQGADLIVEADPELLVQKLLEVKVD